ncbi:MAG: shikimate kinase [Oscillospiraceae bacterium]
MEKNVTLIGMPGAGKSTIGVVLAKILGYKFLDSDLLIQAQEGRLLWQIIKREGIEGFLKIEEQVNSGIVADNTIIATGGSVIYGSKAMAHLREISAVVYLRLSYEKIETRLGNLEKRGVTLPEGWTLCDLYNERTPLYEKYAHITFDCGNEDIRETAVSLAALLQKSTI